MEKNSLARFDAGKTAWLVGIKGTGMCALAEILHARGLIVSGSDVPEEFYTDKVLQSQGIPYKKGFDPSQLPGTVDLAVRSAAYGPENPEVAALEARGIPVYVYPEALGMLSRGIPTGAVSGVHGKTTTTAIAGCLVQSLGLTGEVVVGSAVPAFGNRSTLIQGKDFLIAETCEYRRHFNYFSPDRIILTSVEPDHLDYFRDMEDISEAFQTFAEKLPPRGSLIYCSDDPGAAAVAEKVKENREDIRLQPYGFHAAGPWGIEKLPSLREGENSFRLKGYDQTFRIRIPGDHVIQDAAAAIAMVADQLSSMDIPLDRDVLDQLEKGLYNFTGSRRRSEIVGNAGNVLVMDDYGHHPSAIRKTLEGIREFYPGKRIILDFMSHTYSRTAALLEEFAGSFNAADTVILHKIYASAREEFSGSVSGKDLYRAACRHHGNVLYYEEPDEALPFLLKELKEGDLFITMGAGDNWQLGRRLMDELNKEKFQ